MKERKVTFTAGEIKIIDSTLNQMVQSKFKDSRFALKLYRIINRLSKELDPINKTIADLIQQYVQKDENDIPKRDQVTGKFIYATQEDEVGHEEAFSALRDSQIEVTVPTMSEDEICENMTNVSVGDMSVLDQFIGE